MWLQGLNNWIITIAFEIWTLEQESLSYSKWSSIRRGKKEWKNGADIYLKL